jgi:hypothetical protein
MSYLIKANKGSTLREVEADSKIAAAIHVTAFIADGFSVRVVDAMSTEPMCLDGCPSPEGLSSFALPNDIVGKAASLQP